MQRLQQVVEQQRRQLERMEEEEAEAKRMAVEAKVEGEVEEGESRDMGEVCSLPADGGSCTAASFQR